MTEFLIKLKEGTDPLNEMGEATTVVIWAGMEPSFTDVVREQVVSDSQIERIRLVLSDSDFPPTSFRNILEVVERKASVKHVILEGRGDLYENFSEVAFLPKISLNANIHTVRFCSLQLSGESVAFFLDATPNLTHVVFKNCRWRGQEGLGELGVAIEHNKNIAKLELIRTSEVSQSLLPILSGLKGNSFLGSLAFEVTVEQNAKECSACGELLKVSTSLKRFHLRGDPHALLRNVIDVLPNGTLTRWRYFNPVLRGLTKSRVTEVRLFGCQFQDKASTMELDRMLRFKENLVSFRLHDCSLHQLEFGRANMTMLSLLSPLSLLRDLELISPANLAYPMYRTDMSFGSLLLGVLSSKLKSLALGTIQSQEDFDTLMLHLPFFNLEGLYLAIHSRVQGGRTPNDPWLSCAFLTAAALNRNLIRLDAMNEEGNLWMDKVEDDILASHLEHNIQNNR